MYYNQDYAEQETYEINKEEADEFNPQTVLDSLGRESTISTESDYNSEQLQSTKEDIAWEDIEQEYESEIKELAGVTTAVYVYSKQPTEESSVTENLYDKPGKKDDRMDDIF